MKRVRSGYTRRKRALARTRAGSELGYMTATVPPGRPLRSANGSTGGAHRSASLALSTSPISALSVFWGTGAGISSRRAEEARSWIPLTLRSGLCGGNLHPGYSAPGRRKRGACQETDAPQGVVFSASVRERRRAISGGRVRGNNRLSHCPTGTTDRRESGDVSKPLRGLSPAAARSGLICSRLWTIPQFQTAILVNRNDAPARSSAHLHCPRSA
jgi:hypothetical protein